MRDVFVAVEEIQVFQGIEPHGTLDLQNSFFAVKVQLVFAQQGNGPKIPEGIDFPVQGDAVAIKAERCFLFQQDLPLFGDHLAEADGFRIEGRFRHGGKLQTVYEIVLPFVPVGNEPVGELPADALKLLGVPVADLLLTLFAGNAVAVAFPFRQAAVRAGVDHPFQKFRVFLMGEPAGDLGLVHIELPLDEGGQLLVGHGLHFLRLQDFPDEAAHFAPADHIAPTGLDAVAALDPEDHQGQTQLFGQGSDGGLDVHGFSVEGTVSLGGQGDGAALPGHPDAVFHGLQVRGLLFDGDGSHQPADGRGDPAQGEDILTGNEVKGLPENQHREELVKAGLVVEDHQVGAVFTFRKRLRCDMIFRPDIDVQEGADRCKNHFVPGFAPGLLLFHREPQNRQFCNTIKLPLFDRLCQTFFSAKAFLSRKYQGR